jgi:hypothetical protein
MFLSGLQKRVTATCVENNTMIFIADLDIHSFPSRLISDDSKIFQSSHVHDRERNWREALKERA